MKRYFKAILHFGITPNMSSEEQRYTALTNQMNLATLFIIAIPSLIVLSFLPNHGQISLLRFELLLLACILNLFLNKQGYHLLAKLFTVLLPLFLIFVMPILMNFMIGGMLLWMPYGIITIGCFSLSLFSYTKEKGILISMILFFWLVSITYDNIFVWCATQPLDIGFIKENYVIYKAALTFIGIVLYLNLYIFKRSNYLMQRELDQQNLLLQNLNQNLELQIIERTQKINSQNEKVKELAFTNSHQLRANIARILGLSHIFLNSTDMEEKEFCIEKITENVKAMDVITTDISAKLIEED